MAFLGTRRSRTFIERKKKSVYTLICTHRSLWLFYVSGVSVEHESRSIGFTLRDELVEVQQLMEADDPTEKRLDSLHRKYMLMVRLQ